VTLPWIRAGDGLPPEGEPVLVHLPDFSTARPSLAYLEKGQPSRSGRFYTTDIWVGTSLRSGQFVTTVEPDQLWTRIPTPEGSEAWPRHKPRHELDTGGD